MAAERRPVRASLQRSQPQFFAEPVFPPLHPRLRTEVLVPGSLGTTGREGRNRRILARREDLLPLPPPAEPYSMQAKANIDTSQAELCGCSPDKCFAQTDRPPPIMALDPSIPVAGPREPSRGIPFGSITITRAVGLVTLLFRSAACCS